MNTQLNKAQQLARQLNAKKVDVNEVEKLLAYARRVRDVGKVRRMMQRLATQNVIVYSNQTKGYMQTIQQVLSPALPSDAAAARELLGWVARLMRYERSRQERR